MLASALEAYNAEKWEEALAAYSAAASRPDGQQLRTFNGIYLSNIRLGRIDPAAAAFGKIAALGLATNDLSVKLLSGQTAAPSLARSVRARRLPDVAPADRARRSADCSFLLVVGHTAAEAVQN